MPGPPTRPSSSRMCCALAVVACAAVLAGCADRVATGSKTPPVVDVASSLATVRRVGVDFEAVGTALANDSVQLTSKIASTISAIRFRDGQWVRRGDVLVELENHAQRAAVKEAEAALVLAQQQLERGRNLRHHRDISDSELEQLIAAMLRARAKLASARAALADTVIRAGFDGRVGIRRLSVGSLIEPGVAITSLDDTSRIKVEFKVPENLIYLLDIGLEISASTPGPPGRTFRGVIEALDSRIDMQTRTIAVQAGIPNADEALRPGTFMKIVVHTAESPALMVPEEAIIPEQGNTFVLVVRDSVVERRQVVTGRRVPAAIEIVSGLDASERVVTRGWQNLRAGTVVREVVESPGSG